MQRVSVVGPSGSGKTFARRLADRLDVPCIELDAIFHQPGWTELPTAAFRERVGNLVEGERWVVDGNYSAVRDLVWARPTRWSASRSAGRWSCAGSSPARCAGP